ncbi:MAG: hypothetical protein ACKO3W_14400, partial [bacterium]
MTDVYANDGSMPRAWHRRAGTPFAIAHRAKLVFEKPFQRRADLAHRTGRELGTSRRMDDRRFAMANAVRGGGRAFGASSGEVVVVFAVAA